ncbi:MAG: hypothetical protein KDA57_01265 [Planctomycetales bacterium]|nr:hypothetical protein [Planctomycetales bacterium]
MRSTKNLLLGALAYVLITFPLAYVWHLVTFKSTYERLGYFSREKPIVAFGFAAILTQGMLLSWIYPRLCHGLSFARGAATLALVMGGYHWTTHVLAAAAKQSIEPLSTWFCLETSYLTIQFTLAGLLMAGIYQAMMPREDPT